MVKMRAEKTKKKKTTAAKKPVKMMRNGMGTILYDPSTLHTNTPFQALYLMMMMLMMMNNKTEKKLVHISLTPNMCAVTCSIFFLCCCSSCFSLNPFQQQQ